MIHLKGSGGEAVLSLFRISNLCHSVSGDASF